MQYICISFFKREQWKNVIIVIIIITIIIFIIIIIIIIIITIIVTYYNMHTRAMMLEERW